MHGAPVLEVAAKSHGQVIQAPQFGFQREKVGECLGGVEVSAISGVDYRAVRGKRRRPGGALLVMPHYQNIRIAADDLYRILEVLTLGHRGITRIVKSYDASSKAYHRRLEAHLRTRGRLIEKRRHNFSAALVRVGFGALHDVLGEGHHRVPLGNAVVVHVY